MKRHGRLSLTASARKTARIGRVPDLWHRQKSPAAYLLHDVLRRHHGPLLPARQLRDLITHDEKATIRSQQTGVGFRRFRAVGIPGGPATAFVRNILPGY